MQKLRFKTLHQSRLGLKFSKLTIIGFKKFKKYNSSKVLYKVLCTCGNQKYTTYQFLKNGSATSCAGEFCRKPLNAMTKHGMARTRTYRCWLNMWQRCVNPKNNNYKYYGLKGIKVCKRWSDFETFFIDMGHMPKSKSIDRINNYKGYSPWNCRWATRQQQQKNMRRNSAHCAEK